MYILVVLLKCFLTLIVLPAQFVATGKHFLASLATIFDERLKNPGILEDESGDISCWKPHRPAISEDRSVAGILNLRFCAAWSVWTTNTLKKYLLLQEKQQC
jgi:hypothetical protein